MKTSNALGLTIPPSLLLPAAPIIEGPPTSPAAAPPERNGRGAPTESASSPGALFGILGQHPREKALESLGPRTMLGHDSSLGRARRRPPHDSHRVGGDDSHRFAARCLSPGLPNPHGPPHRGAAAGALACGAQARQRSLRLQDSRRTGGVRALA